MELEFRRPDVMELFLRYDKEQNGHIKYYEFIQHLLPNDFISQDKLKQMGGIPGGPKDRNHALHNGKQLVDEKRNDFFTDYFSRCFRRYFTSKNYAKQKVVRVSFT